jgi:hypothetical protein
MHFEHAIAFAQLHPGVAAFLRATFNPIQTNKVRQGQQQGQLGYIWNKQVSYQRGLCSHEGDQGT